MRACIGLVRCMMQQGAASCTTRELSGPPLVQYYQVLTKPRPVAHHVLIAGQDVCCQFGGFGMNVNTPILREISFQLIQGNPWWGMLLANEYVDQSHPLRPICIRKFTQSIGDVAAGQRSLAKALIRGKRRAELSASQSASVGSRVISSSSSQNPLRAGAIAASSSYPARSSQRLSSTPRLAVRQRNTHVARFSSSNQGIAERRHIARSVRLAAV